LRYVRDDRPRIKVRIHPIPRHALYALILGLLLLLLARALDT